MKINRILLQCGLLALAGCAATPVATPLPTSTPTLAPTLAPTPTASPAAIEPLTPAMVLVEPGSFMMGSEEGLRYERPVHEVQLTRAYYIGQFPVTFEEYDLFCADTGRSQVADNGWGRGQRPLTNINWYDAVEYCNWLSVKEGLEPAYTGSGKTIECNFDASGYRLPTEAEWEFAARGGNQSQNTLYAGSNDPDQVGWFKDNAGGMTQPVGLKEPNELGIYDMSGNMWELCWDWYGKEYYQIAASVDPTGPESGTDRARRGGHFLESEDTLRVTYRSFDLPTYSANGFRLARTK